MKVLHLSGAFIWGGNEQQLVNLIYSLNNKNIKNIILCFKGSPIEKFAHKNKIKYISVENSSQYSVKQAKNLSKYVKNENIDIIHIHSSNFVTVFLISDIIYHLRKPTILSKKSMSNSSSFLSSLKYNYKGIDKIICVSNAVKESFKTIIYKKNHPKLRVIYDGIKIEKEKYKQILNLKKKYNIAPEKKLIGNIANHSKSKDLGVFIKTANELINNRGFKNVHFIQIGKKLKYTDEFIGLIEDYNLNSYISFVGKIENAKSLLEQFDIYLMTSKNEGLPLTIYEAFLNRIPVISTKAGGIPEAIIDNENGLLAEVGDYKKLTKHIIRLLGDESLQSQFTKNSYEKLVSFFDADCLTQDTIELYNSIKNKFS